MSEASPGHIGDVQQAIDSAEIDKRAVLGEVLHHAGEDRAFFQVLQGLGALLVLLFFQQICLRETTMLPRFLFSLMTRNFERLALHAVEIADRPQIDL